MSRAFLIILLAVGAVLIPMSAQALGVGDKAPLFSADSNRGEISLAHYLGEKYVILAFYFAINTPA